MIHTEESCFAAPSLHVILFEAPLILDMVSFIILGVLTRVLVPSRELVQPPITLQSKNLGYQQACKLLLMPYIQVKALTVDEQFRFDKLCVSKSIFALERILTASGYCKAHARVNKVKVHKWSKINRRCQILFFDGRKKRRELRKPFKTPNVNLSSCSLRKNSRSSSDGSAAF